MPHLNLSLITAIMFPVIKNEQLGNKEVHSPTIDVDDNPEVAPKDSASSSEESERSHDENTDTCLSSQKSKKSHKNSMRFQSTPYGQWSGRRNNQRTRASQTSNKDTTDFFSQRVQSARNLKIHELSNEIEDLRRQMRDTEQENRLLKNELIRHERNLSKLPGSRGDIQEILKSHQDEVHALRMLINQLKEKKRELEKKLKARDMQIYKQQKEIQHLIQLNKDKHLPERKELWKKVEALKEELAQSNKHNEDLSRRMEISTKALKQDLSNEMAKHRETQQRLNHLQMQHEKLQGLLKEKQKELDRRNIYSNSGASCRPTSTASSLTPSNFSKQILSTAGSSSDQSSFSDEPVKSTYCPSVHGGGAADTAASQKLQKDDPYAFRKLTIPLKKYGCQRRAKKRAIFMQRQGEACKAPLTAFQMLLPSLTDDDKVQTKTELPEKESKPAAGADKKGAFNFADTEATETRSSRSADKRKTIVIRGMKSPGENGAIFGMSDSASSEGKGTYILNKYSNGQCTLSCMDPSNNVEHPKKEKLSEESKQMLLSKLKSLDQEADGSNGTDGLKKTKKVESSSEKPSFDSTDENSSSVKNQKKKKHDLMATLFGNEIVQCPVSPVKKIEQDRKSDEELEFEWLGKKPSSSQSYKRTRPSNGWVELSTSSLMSSSDSHCRSPHQEGVIHIGTVDVATDIDGNTFKVHKKSDHAFVTRCLERDKSYAKSTSSYYGLKSSEV